MKRLVAVGAGFIAFGFGGYRAMARATEPPAEVPSAATTRVQDGFEPILKAQHGRYSKHGWNHYGPGYFELDAATGVLTSRGGMGLFWYAARQYTNFVLELEYMTNRPSANSGIFLRVPEVPTSDDYIYHSFEIQINDGQEGVHHTGAVYDAEPPTARAERPPGEWNAFRITFDGDRITVELNGQTVVDWDAAPRGKIEDFASRGYIGLQNHDDNSTVRFRNIRVRELP